MKIAYVLGMFPSVSETFILREIDALRQHGCEVLIFALRRPAGPCALPSAQPPPVPVCYRPALLSAAVLAAQVHFLWRGPGRYLRLLGQACAAAWPYPLTLLRTLRNFPVAVLFARVAADAGVEHVHAHFAYAPADVARTMAGFLRREFSVSAHARDIHVQPRRLLERRLRTARFVAVCSQAGLAALRSRLSPALAERLHLVYHGLDPARFAAAPAAPGPEILAVGRLEPKKGLPHLVEACRILHARGTAFHCAIVGEGPERGRLETLIARGGLGSVVTLMGARTEAEVLDLYRRARVCALPCVVAADGDRDGVPNAILEALAAGVPVVATAVGGIPEVIEDGVTGWLVPAGDAAALADRIEELLKNEAMRQRMFARGRAVIAARFDSAKNIVPLVALFQRCVALGCGRQPALE